MIKESGLTQSHLNMSDQSWQDQLAEIRQIRARQYQTHQVEQAVEASKSVDRTSAADSRTTQPNDQNGSTSLQGLAQNQTKRSKQESSDDEIEFVGISTGNASKKARQQSPELVHVSGHFVLNGTLYDMVTW